MPFHLFTTLPFLHISQNAFIFGIICFWHYQRCPTAFKRDEHGMKLSRDQENALIKRILQMDREGRPPGGPPIIDIPVKIGAVSG
jgi:hypothetical protein